MKRLLVAAGLLFVVSALLFASGTQTEAAAEEMRPVWVWGTPAWGGDYDPEVLEVSNKWAMENFGVTFKITSGIPQDMTGDQALQLVLAEGEFPDLIRGVSFEMLASLADEGRLLGLDKYFEDPENFPVYTGADKSELLKFRVEGTLYGIPGYGWRVNKDDPAWVNPQWQMRKDVYEKYGYPTTSQELLDTMRKGKASGEFLNLDDEPIYWMNHQGGHSPSMFERVMWQFKGAGFEVDPQKRLLPVWASEQAYEAMKYFNLMWREGMMSPGVFMMNNEKFQESMKNLSYGFNSGSTWNIAVGGRGIVKQLEEKYGRYAEETQRVAKSLMIMLVNPISENPGRIGNGGYGGPPNPTVVSAETPNPDGAVGYLHWLLTDEGIIACMFQAGYQGVHWDYADPDDHGSWEMLPPYDTGDHLQHSQSVSHNWESNENAKDPEKTPLYPPVVQYLSSRSYSSYYVPLRNIQMAYYFTDSHKDLWPEPLKAGDPTVLEWDLYYSQACLEIVQPLASYVQVTAPAPPMEVTALSSATERFQGGIAQLIMSETEAEFEKNYSSFMDKMIGVANWKPIYEARQQRWLDWMKSNNIDDRAGLNTVNPIPKWKDVMGW